VTLYRVFPDPRLAIDETTPAGLDSLTDLYRITTDRSVRVNMVVTPSGESIGPDRTSGSLSRPTDRTLVRLLRQQADAVIIGAGTLRVEKVPVPPDTPLVVLSHSGQIAAENIVTSAASGELVVVTPSPERARLTLGELPHRIIAAPAHKHTPADIIALCHAEGWNHLLVEGGQHTATAFAEAGVVDDLCLTLTGAPREETTPPLAWWPTTHQWDAHHLLTDDDRMLYYRLGRSSRQID
jgi:riboflavin biosynthesis pyrimidine reductase